ncbi:MAG: hypothetical protein H6551_05515 [Chitinophagales bacterium]|nr:hypothetical protein [Chitinophagaceae bacterium]MCB9064588.1 hypothetical protein [Chitinophagales bacterium]
MKRALLTIIFSALCLGMLYAQPKDRDMHEKVKALKVAFITNKLELTSEQSAAFWPVYNEFEKEKRELKKDFMSEYKDKNPTTDDKTAHQYINDNLDYQEKELALKKKYKDKLLKVISATQLAELYRSEQDFKRMLLDELKQRRGSGHRPTR